MQGFIATLSLIDNQIGFSLKELNLTERHCYAWYEPKSATKKIILFASELNPPFYKTTSFVVSKSYPIF